MKPALNVEAPAARRLPVDGMAPTHVETATFAVG